MLATANSRSELGLDSFVRVNLSRTTALGRDGLQDPNGSLTCILAPARQRASRRVTSEASRPGD